MKTNRIINGDALEELKKLPENFAEMTLTDIPYDGVNRESGGLRVLDKGAADIATFQLEDFLPLVQRVTKGSIYIFCGHNQFSTIFKHFELDKDWSVRGGCWVKTNPSPMNGEHLWLSGFELCVFARKSKATFNRNCENSVWRYPSGTSKSHPTEKPVDLFSYLIASSTKQGDMVLDPCLGSGTTGIAAVKLNRRWLGIEIDANYAEIARRRTSQQGLGI